jgi:hypothetical protein
MNALVLSLGIAAFAAPDAGVAVTPVKTSTVAHSLVGIDLELAKYLALLESFEEINDLELLELLPLLEDEDDR